MYLKSEQTQYPQWAVSHSIASYLYQVLSATVILLL